MEARLQRQDSVANMGLYRVTYRVTSGRVEKHLLRTHGKRVCGFHSGNHNRPVLSLENAPRIKPPQTKQIRPVPLKP